MSDEVRLKVAKILAKPAFRQDYDLYKQLKRAAESAGPNVAEGFSRYLPRDFARFVRIAKRSLTEVLEHMRSARERAL